MTLATEWLTRVSYPFVTSKENLPMTRKANLLKDTLQLLENRTESIELIARNASTDECYVTTSWINKLRQGKIEDPSVLRLQAVHDYLSARR